jgi:cephalosporin hydroxylase
MKTQNQENMTPFEMLPFVKRVRELRQISGGSLSCGWMYDDVAFFLYSLVKFYKPELVIQTGHLWGKSALITLEGINDGFLNGDSEIDDKEQNSDKEFSNFVFAHKPRLNSKPKFISIDPGPQNVPNSAAGIDYLKQIHPNFEFHEKFSTKFFEENSEDIKSRFAGQRIMGIVDGDHTWMGCLQDLESLAALNAQLILVDDTIWLPDLARVTRAFAKRYGYDFLNLSLHNGVALLYKDDFRKCMGRKYVIRDFLYAIGGLRLVKTVRKLIGR